MHLPHTRVQHIHALARARTHPPLSQIFNMAIMAGMRWKAAPKDDFYQEVLDLLGEISLDTRKQLEDAVKALEKEEQEAG